MPFTQPVQVDRYTRTTQITEQHIQNKNNNIIIIIDTPICKTRNRGLMEIIVSLSKINIPYGVRHENCLFVDVMPCSLVEMWRRFIGFCCFPHRRMMFAAFYCVDLIR